MEKDLSQALTRGEFEVHYQPQINMRSRRVDGFEALVRWRLPQARHGSRPANSFR